MRVAVAFILLFTITLAFTIEKERPLFEDEADRLKFFDIRDENEPEEQEFEGISDENVADVPNFQGIRDENEPEEQKLVGIGDESQENNKVIDRLSIYFRNS